MANNAYDVLYVYESIHIHMCMMLDYDMYWYCISVCIYIYFTKSFVSLKSAGYQNGGLSWHEKKSRYEILHEKTWGTIIKTW